MPTKKPRFMVVIDPKDVDRINRAAACDQKAQGNRSVFIREAIFDRVTDIEENLLPESAESEAA